MFPSIQIQNNQIPLAPVCNIIKGKISSSLKIPNTHSNFFIKFPSPDKLLPERISKPTELSVSRALSIDASTDTKIFVSVERYFRICLCKPACPLKKSLMQHPKVRGLFREISRESHTNEAKEHESHAVAFVGVTRSTWLSCLPAARLRLQTPAMHFLL